MNMGNDAVSISSPSFNGSSAMSFEQFYKNYTGNDKSPYELGSRIGNWFTGEVSSARDAYDNYLTSLNQAREDSSFQRQVKDILAAGYNPYMALGSISSSNSSQAYERKDQKKENEAISSALKILSLFLLKKLF